IRISGHGGEINGSSATGGLTVDGEFYGAIRADKIAKGVRFLSRRTDLTLSQLAGHMEANPGNLEIFDAPGNLSVRTQDDITLENAGEIGRHTSELQSPYDLVCRLLLEKKKKKMKEQKNSRIQ